LLAPEEQYFLYRNLELMLLTARIALLKSDEASFRESLRSARSWLETYFDTAANDVRTAISDLVALESSDVKPNLPQIGAALQQLRAMRSSPGPVAVPASDKLPDSVAPDPEAAGPETPEPEALDPETQDNVETDQ
jgi:uroporphyrin-3 C-methyltransferase